MIELAPEDAVVEWLRTFIDDKFKIQAFSAVGITNEDLGLVVHTRNARHLSNIPPGEDERIHEPNTPYGDNGRIYEVDMWFSFSGQGDMVALMSRTAWQVVKAFRNPLAMQHQVEKTTSIVDTNPLLERVEQIRVLGIRLFSGPRPLSEDGVRLGHRTGISVEGVATVAMEEFTRQEVIP